MRVGFDRFPVYKLFQRLLGTVIAIEVDFPSNLGNALDTKVWKQLLARRNVYKALPCGGSIVAIFVASDRICWFSFPLFKTSLAKPRRKQRMTFFNEAFCGLCSVLAYIERFEAARACRKEKLV